MVRVAKVHPGSLGEELGLRPGTELRRVNGRGLEDFLDWEFLTADDQFVLLATMPDGEQVEFDVERPEGLPMGVELEPPRIRRCANRCDFCFVDGLPPGLRETLYVRDDDYRLSFRYGNFATLTNLKARDIDRILEYRLSPLYVSVHTTDSIMRRRLLRNPTAPDILPLLRQLGEGGICFHTQIVLQPGVNDGEHLERSLEDLYRLGAAVLSVSVVPVELTAHSKRALVREATPAECRAALELVETWSARARSERGRHWAYGSDGLYLAAHRPLPDAERYDDFDQVENGVGAVRFLQGRIAGGRYRDRTGQRIGVLTGTAMERLMPQVLEPLSAATGARFELLVLENRLFGPSVTSAALLPGETFLRAIVEHELDLALVPAEAVNDDERFLDGLPFSALAEAAPCPVLLSRDFADVLAE